MTTAGLETFEQAIAAFPEVARDYCELIESRPADASTVFSALDWVLPSLYANASKLSSSAPDNVYDAPSDAASGASPGAIARGGMARLDELEHHLEALVGDWNVYLHLEQFPWEWTEDGIVRDFEVHEESVSSTLVGIYEWLAAQLPFYESGLAEQVFEAGRGWLLGFHGEWSETLPQLLGMVNHYVYGTLDEDAAESGE